MLDRNRLCLSRRKQACRDRRRPIGAIDGAAPELDSPGQRPDQLAHFLAQPRLADAQLAMFGIHRFDETLGQRHGLFARGGPTPLEPHGGQAGDRRQHCEPPVQRVRHLPGHEPMLLAGLADQRIEQRTATAWHGR